MSSSRTSACLVGMTFAVLAVSCGSSPPAIPPQPIPVLGAGEMYLPTGGDSLVPAEGVRKEFGRAGVAKIASSLKSAWAISSATLPIAHVRIVIEAGHSETPLNREGVAEIVGQLVRDGGAGKWSAREVAERIDLLGAEVSVDVGVERVVFGISVTKDKLEDAIALLGAMVSKPKLDAKEFAKIKARELDRLKQAEHSNGSWMAKTALYRELFQPGDPYRSFDGTSRSVENLTLKDAETFYRNFYKQSRTSVFVAGDVVATTLGPLLDRYLGDLPKSRTVMPHILSPALPPSEVVFVKKAGAKQADVMLGTKTIRRSDAHYPDLALFVHALGGGMASRLFADVREKRSLAYSTYAGTRDFAHRESVLVLYAGTQSGLADKGAEALLEHLSWITKDRPVTEEELAVAKRSLDTNFIFGVETLSSVARIAIEHEALKLPGTDVYDYIAKFRASLQGATAASLAEVGKSIPRGTLAVAGDESIAKNFTKFGKVKILDPEKDFAVVGTLTADK